MRLLLACLLAVSTPAFAQQAPLLSAAPSSPAPPAPATYRDEHGAVLLSPCEPDGRFVVSGFTPAAKITGPLDKWFATTIQSRIASWTGETAATPPIKTTGNVLTSAGQFQVGKEGWHAWFYAVARGDRAQWAVVAAPAAMSIDDLRLLAAQEGVMNAYSGSLTLGPEGLAAGARPPSRPTDAKNEFMGRLISSPLKFLLGQAPSTAERDYLLMRDGSVFDAADGSTYTAKGRWVKSGATYQITWNTGFTETMPDVCFRGPAVTTAKSAGVAKSCKTVSRTISTPNLRTVCGASGQTCTLQSTPLQSTVSQEECG